MTRQLAWAPSPLRSVTWDHPQSIWVCETAELLAGFGAPPGEATRRLLWAAAGLPRGRPCVHPSRSGQRGRTRADETNVEALAVLDEACAAASRLAEDDAEARPELILRRRVALDLIDDALTALREALDLTS